MTRRVTSAHHFLGTPHEDWHLNTDVGLQDCGRQGCGAHTVDRYVELHFLHLYRSGQNHSL